MTPLTALTTVVIVLFSQAPGSAAPDFTLKTLNVVSFEMPPSSRRWTSDSR